MYDDHELIARQSRQRVSSSQPCTQPARSLLQQFIAGYMSERIVDGFEAIQIHHHHGEAALVAFGVRDGLFEAIREQQTVGQSGQGVMRGDVLQLRIGLFELLVVAAGFGFQMRVVHQQNRGDRQHRKRQNADRGRQPEAVQPCCACAVRAGAEAGGRHSGVVHTADRQSHDECGAYARDRHLP